jgi:hypothetical protein
MSPNVTSGAFGGDTGNIEQTFAGNRENVPKRFKRFTPSPGPSASAFHASPFADVAHGSSMGQKK